MKIVCFAFLVSVLIPYVTSLGVRVSCNDQIVTVTTYWNVGINNWYVMIRAPTGNASLGCTPSQFQPIPGTNDQEAEVICKERTDFIHMVLTFQMYDDGRMMLKGEAMKSEPIRCTLGDTAITGITIENGKGMLNLNTVEGVLKTASILVTSKDTFNKIHAINMADRRSGILLHRDFEVLTIPNVDSEIDIGLLAESSESVYAFSDRVKISLSRGQKGTVINIKNVYTIGPDDNIYYLIKDKCSYDFGTSYVAEQGAETKEFTFDAFAIFDPFVDTGNDYALDIIIEVAVCRTKDASACDYFGDCGIPIGGFGRRRRQVKGTTNGSTNETKSLTITVVSSQAEKNRILGLQAEQQALVSPVTQTVKAPDEKLCANKTVAALVLALLSTGLVSFFIATLFLILRQKNEVKLDSFPSSRKTVYSVSNRSLK